MSSQIAQFTHSDDVTSSENVSRIIVASSEDGQPPLKKPKMEPLEDVNDQTPSSSRITIKIPITSTIRDILNNTMDSPTYSIPPDVYKIFEDHRLLKHDDDDFMCPTPMAKQRGDVAQYCRYIFRILRARFSEYDIEQLQKYKQLRSIQYKGLVQEGLLRKPAHKDSKIEQLPLYAFLMPPKPRIHGLHNGKMYFRDDIHGKIFNASMINDDDVAECIRYRTTPSECSSEGSSQVIVMRSQPMIECLKFIKNGRSDWRDLMNGDNILMVLDVLKVPTMDDVEDGKFLVCYEEMPPITTILDKNLNCVVINPSDDSLRFILDHQRHVHYQGNMAESAYGGNLGNLNYRCFGPKIEKPKMKIPTSISSTAMFKTATKSANCKQSANLEGNIYAVEGFF